MIIRTRIVAALASSIRTRLFFQKRSIKDMSIKDDDRFRAHRFCSEHLGGAWSRVAPNEILFEPISGGMSNSLYCCSLPEPTMVLNGEPHQVLLRLYGDQSKNCDMSIQLEIFKLLSLKNLGPKLYGHFDDGRLEEFLPATSLTCEELMNHDISSIIAKKLASVHSLNVPIDKQNTWLLDRYQEWLEFITNEEGACNFSEDVRQSTREIANKLLAIDYNEEIKFLRGLFDRTRSPMVFSHNDLHQGNILLGECSKRRPTLEERIVLIDFEYCSYNYRAYDIANHFCEWCFEYDTPDYPHFRLFENRFPSKSSQKFFIRHYLDQHEQLATLQVAPVTTNGVANNHITHNDNNHCDTNGSTNGHHKVNGHYFNGTSKRPEQLEAEEDAMLEEIQPFFMAANFLWTLWCIKSAQSSTIKFGYWEHAMARWKLYSQFKASYLEDIQNSRELTNGNGVSL